MNPNQIAKETSKILFEYGPRIHDLACKVMDVYTKPPEFKLTSGSGDYFFVDEDNSVVANSNTIHHVLEELQRNYARYNPSLKELVVYSLEEEIPHYNHFVQHPNIWIYGAKILREAFIGQLNNDNKKRDQKFRQFVLQRSYIEGVGKKARILIENELEYPPKHLDIILTSLNLKNIGKWWDTIRENIGMYEESYMHESFGKTHDLLSGFIGRHLASKWNPDDLKRFAKQYKFEFTDEDFEILNKTINELFPSFDQVFPWLIKGSLDTRMKVQ